ncbi:MAG: ribonuclease E inhibitor RraB [Planctomycetota bacterium]
MGFFGSIFGCSKGDKAEQPRFVTAAAFHENLGRQTTMSPQTVAALRKHGVASDANLKLEFFFYTDTEAKALQLTEALQTLAYSVESGPSAGDARQFVVSGWTTPIRMTDEAVVDWTETMCHLGYEHDCDFDGWGTNPEQ